MFFKMFFIKVKKHVFYVFYLQINVFIIYAINSAHETSFSCMVCVLHIRKSGSVYNMQTAILLILLLPHDRLTAKSTRSQVVARMADRTASQQIIYTVSHKKHVTTFSTNNLNNKCPITIIFGIVSSQSRRHRKMVSFPTSHRWR